MTELSDRTYEKAQVWFAEGGPLSDSEVRDLSHAFMLLYREHQEIVGWASRTVKAFAEARKQYDAEMIEIDEEARSLGLRSTRHGGTR